MSRLFIILFLLSSNLLFFLMYSIGIIGHFRRIFDYPILFSYYHYFQSLGISGILLAIICSLLSIIYLFRFICQRHYLQSSHIDAVIIYYLFFTYLFIIYLFRNRAIKINIINARIGEK